jgi:DNA-binding XRE family transcriptional regulator
MVKRVSTQTRARRAAIVKAQTPGAVVQEWRALHGWSRQQLADRLGVSMRTMWTYEMEEGPPWVRDALRGIAGDAENRG